jgi:hypothetical protein
MLESLSRGIAERRNAGEKVERCDICSAERTRRRSEFRMTTPRTNAEIMNCGKSRGPSKPLGAADLEMLVQKLKLLEFGLYGLQQYGRNAPLDVEDIGPFYRLAEEIESDVLELQRRVGSSEEAELS